MNIVDTDVHKVPRNREMHPYLPSSLYWHNAPLFVEYDGAVVSVKQDGVEPVGEAPFFAYLHLANESTILS